MALNTADLLALSQVSSCLNTRALLTFLIFHGMTISQIAFIILSMTSLSLPAFRLAIFIPSLKVRSIIRTQSTQELSHSLARISLNRRSNPVDLSWTLDLK
jgi:hypothetical protein